MNFTLEMRSILDSDDYSGEKISDYFRVEAFDPVLEGTNVLAGLQNRQTMFVMLANQRTSTKDYSSVYRDYFESISVLNKTFSEVYTYDYIYRTYYNKEFGIVAFTDFDNQQWVLDRIE